MADTLDPEAHDLLRTLGALAALEDLRQASQVALERTADVLPFLRTHPEYHEPMRHVLDVIGQSVTILRQAWTGTLTEERMELHAAMAQHSMAELERLNRKEGDNA